MSGTQQSGTQQASSGGISILGLLGVVFVTLKLLGKIAWSWWWVTAPFWAPLAIVILLVGAVLVGATLAKAAR